MDVTTHPGGHSEKGLLGFWIQIWVWVYRLHKERKRERERDVAHAGGVPPGALCSRSAREGLGRPTTRSTLPRRPADFQLLFSFDWPETPCAVQAACRRKIVHDEYGFSRLRLMDFRTNFSVLAEAWRRVWCWGWRTRPRRLVTLVHHSTEYTKRVSRRACDFPGRCCWKGFPRRLRHDCCCHCCSRPRHYYFRRHQCRRKHFS